MLNFISVGLLFSQNLFARFYSESQCDYGWTLVATSDGGVAFAGLTENPSTGDYDFGLVKLNSSGVMEWKYGYGGTGYEAATGLVLTSEGQYALAGESSSFGGDYKTLLIKVNTAGGITWASTFTSSSGTVRCPSLARTTDGGYALGGTTWSGYTYDSSAIVIKATSSGGFSWARQFNETNGREACRAVCGTSDGGVIAAGYRTNASGNKDILLLKLSSAGSLDWAKAYGGSGEEWAASVIQTADGGYALLGQTKSFSDPTYGELILIKLNSSGDIQWARTYDMTYVDWPSALIQAPDNGYVISYYLTSGGFSILKTSSDGSLQWARGSGVTGSDYSVYEGESLARTADGGYALAGFRFSGITEYDFFVIKVAQDGSYPGCVSDLTPTVNSVSLTTENLTTSLATFPCTQTSVSATRRDLNLTPSDNCPPAEAAEAPPRPEVRVICVPVLGGAMFLAGEATDLSVYAADGRRVYSGTLIKGENRIQLGQGVYLWRAGEGAWGKVAVR